MELTISRRDVILTTLILAAFGSWVAYALHVNRVLRSELNQRAAMHIDDWFEGGEFPLDLEDFDYLAIVDSERAFKLFGRGWGVIHFYIREKGDEEFNTFKGLEYYYTHDDGEWKLKDSAGCGAFEHHLRAFDEFAKLGVDVPNKVYDRALGINFDYDVSHLDARNASDRQ
jgi:hypothetical protein